MMRNDTTITALRHASLSHSIVDIAERMKLKKTNLYQTPTSHGPHQILLISVQLFSGYEMCT
jgi:hypothetical protein